MFASQGRWVVDGFSRASVTLAILFICAAVLSSGCNDLTTSVEELSQFPAGGPLVLSGKPQEDANTYTETMRDLSEAEWDVLEQFAPRSMWERLRDRRKIVLERRAKIAKATGGGDNPSTEPAKLPDVPTETLPGGKIQMYYRVHHFGGAVATSNGSAGMERTKVTVAPGNLAPLADLVKERLAGKGSVTVLANEQTLVINCDATEKDTVLSLLQKTDRQLPQVDISGQIFEVGHDMDFQLGVKSVVKHLDSRGATQWAFGSTFSPASFAGVVGGTPIGTPNPGSALGLFDIFGKSGITGDITIQALAATGLAKMVAQPRMTAHLGYPASLLAGQEVPVSQARITGSNSGFVTDKTTYKPIGVQLYVTPLVVGDETIKLHIKAVVSSIQGFVEFPQINSLTTPVYNPIIDSREVETTVTVPDGGALVIGGLRKVRTVTSESKIPGLGDIPVLGWLFKSHRSQKQTMDLYFFVSPKIIRN